MASYFVSSASGAGGAGNGSSWANAYLTLAACMARPIAGGDVIFVGDDHVEFTSGSPNWFFPSSATAPGYIYVVDHTKASPTAADLKVGTPTGGYISSDNTLVFNMFGYVYGLYLECGVGSSASTPNIQCGSSRTMVFDHCTFKNSSTNASARLIVPGSSGVEDFKDCTFIPTHGTMAVAASGCYGKFTNCTFLFPNGSPSPFFLSTVSQLNWTFEGCDFSAYAGTQLFAPAGNGGVFITLKDCKLPSSALPFTCSTALRAEQDIIWVINCGYSGTETYRTDIYHYAGELHISTGIRRTGGASQGVPYSWQIATYSTNYWYMPVKLPPISIWNPTIGAAVNVTIEGIADPRIFVALPNNDDIWIDVEALQTASRLQGTITTGTKVAPLAAGTALTASTAAWDCPSFRSNTMSFGIGIFTKVSSNPGRIFMCTVAGTTASSLPGGYATAVDGGTVIDGTATFQAMWRFKQTITTGTIQLVGLITVYPKVAKPSIGVTAPIYLDPFITLS